MTSREDAFLRHQRERWLRPDAARWVRLDIARYLRPGSNVVEAGLSVERKYSPNQPRVPAGNPDGGQWTDGSIAGSTGLFQITPRVVDDTTNVQLAGDPPGIGDNGGPPLEPPQIPKARPSASDARMDIVWNVTEWIGRIGRASPLVGTLFEANEQAEWFANYEAMTKTYHDPPETLDQLQQKALERAEPGYQDHHIEEQGLLESLGYSRSYIDRPDNIVRIPTLKHYDITAWYATRNPDFGGLSPREYLKSQSAEVRRQVGLDKLIEFGVLKP